MLTKSNGKKKSKAIWRKRGYLENKRNSLNSKDNNRNEKWISLECLEDKEYVAKTKDGNRDMIIKRAPKGKNRKEGN